jgi:hypothetical protein
MKTFTFPSGQGYLSVRSTRPDPSRRFSVTVTNDAGISSRGLIELGKFLIQAGKDYSKDEAENGAPTIRGTEEGETPGAETPAG